MLKNFEQFADLVEKHAVINATAVFQEGTADLTRRVAIDTPVDTGRATANWKGGVNREPRGASNEFDKSPTAKRTYEKLREDIKSADIDDTIIVRNSVDDGQVDSDGYIIRLEEGASTQAPNGMFIKNMVRAQKSFDRTTKKLGLK